MSSQLKVNSIRDTSNNEGLTISSGNVSFNNTISAGTIGNNVAVQGSFGVTDISSLFVNQTGWTNHNHASIAYHFNGFVFVNLNIYHASADPSHDEICIQITDAGGLTASDYFPTQNTTFPTISYQGDYASFIQINTSGNVKVSYPVGFGVGDNFFIAVNGFYRI